MILEVFSSLNDSVKGWLLFPYSLHSSGEGIVGRLKNAGLKGIAMKMVCLPSYRKNTELSDGIFLVFPFRQTHHLLGCRIFCNSMQRQESLCKAAAKQMRLIHCRPFKKIKIVNSAVLFLKAQYRL